jgi:SAM-dependent methyltransferase
MAAHHGSQKPANVSAFPSLYHAHHQAYTEDIPFWLSLARVQGGPILELGCGTGRVLLRLAEEGYTCYGLDHDPAMLALLHESQQASSTRQITTILADMSGFQVLVSFPLIILPCNTYSTLATPLRITTLNHIYQHLAPGGIFAASVPNPGLLAVLETEDQPEMEMFFPHPETQNPVQVSCSIVRESSSVAFHWYYDHLFPDGQVERLAIAIVHQLTSMEQYLQEYHSAGFQVKTIYGDFDCTPYLPDSPNLIIIAQKI